MEKEFKAARKKIRIRLKAAEFENALLVCEELISQDVHSAEIFYYQGLCFYRLQQLSTAILSYERALSIDENYLDALKGLSLCMLNADDDRATPQKKLSVLKKLLEVDPEIKNAEPMKKQISLSHWKVAEYDLSFQALLSLSIDHAREVQRIMFTEVSKTNSALCYKQLHFILAKDKDLMPTSNKMKFYYEYGSILNEQGEDPRDLINLMVSNLDFYRQTVRVDSSGGSIGSDETGVQVTPNTEEWWPSQTLSAQLWIIWDQISDWNGSPKLKIPEDVSVSLEETSLILRKDKCTAKTIFHLLQDLDYDKCQDVIDLCTGDMMNNATCSHYNSMCRFHDEICNVHLGNPTVMFLRSVARATIRKDVEKIPDTLAILEKILQERPTYHNSSLLKLVARFRCYVIHTFNLPNDLVYLRESALQDPIIEAWLALMENSTTILTCEHPHPMVDAVKQYILKNTKRHVNIDKLLSVRDAHPKNFTYSTLLLKVLKREIEEGEYDKTEFEKIVNKCYVNDKKNPTILFYLGDISMGQHKDPIAAARYYEKSIRISGSLEMLKLLDSLPQTDDMIRELNIKSHNHLLKTSHDHKLHVRLAMLHTNNHKQAIKHLQQALKISPDPLTLELLAEKYLSLGKYRSAYKSYSKAAELEPTSYRQYSLAAILLQLGRPNEALVVFQEVLESNRSYGPALLGCVKSVYQLAVNCVLHSARHAHAVFLANQCVQYLDQVLHFEPRWSVTWKYLGDVCLLLVQLRDSTLTVTNNIQTALDVEEQEMSDKGLVTLAVKSYNKGLELEPGCSEYLLDLTRSYLELARYQEEYLFHALTLAKRAVRLRPRDHLAWNMLGAVCIKRKVYNLAQHAHIKSLMLNKDDNPAAWTNLGLLYMLNNEFQLANQCYSEAQSNDPKYAQCWVAMAYLARQMGYEDEAGRIFKDLIQDRERRTTVEGTLEYAVKFCGSEMSTEMIHEVLTLTTRCSYLKHSADWLLFNISGVLSEQLDLHKQALQHYVKATTLAPTTEVRVELKRNIDRVQCKLGNYSTLNETNHSLWLALAHMKRGQYGMASSILDSMSGNEVAAQMDVSVFQAVLCWISEDMKSISTHLQTTSSDISKVMKCLMLSEDPSQELRSSINSRDSDLQAKFACLSLKLHDAFQLQSDSSPSTAITEMFSKINAIPVNSKESQYLLAKYLIIHQLEMSRARQILERLIKLGALREDIFELYLEGVMCDVSRDAADMDTDKNSDSNGTDKTTDNSETNNGQTENGETDKSDSDEDIIRKYTLKSYHMFPWRQNSKSLFQRYITS